MSTKLNTRTSNLKCYHQINSKCIVSRCVLKFTSIVWLFLLGVGAVVSITGSKTDGKKLKRELRLIIINIKSNSQDNF